MDYTLWSGNGIIPGHMEDVYLGQSENFGILMGLCFVLQYISYLPVAFTSSALIIMVLCNSQSVIDCITSTRQQAKHILPGETIKDDYNIYNKIAHTIQCLQLVNLQFIHINGYQEREKKKQLSLPVKLNIECNTWPNKYLSIACTIPPKPNPTLPTSYLHLCIHGVTIVATQQCREIFAMLPLLQLYMHKKNSSSRKN